MSASLTAYGWGLALILSLGGCDSTPPVALPHCRDGQGLGTDTAGSLQCITLQPTGLTVPLPAAGCNAGQTVGYTEFKGALTCIDISYVLDEHLEGKQLRSHIADLKQK